MPLAAAFFRKFQHTPGQHTPDPRLAVYEGDPFIVLFWGTWGMLTRGQLEIFLASNPLVAGGFHPNHPSHPGLTDILPSTNHIQSSAAVLERNKHPRNICYCAKLKPINILVGKGTKKKDFPEKKRYSSSGVEDVGVGRPIYPSSHNHGSKK